MVKFVCWISERLTPFLEPWARVTICLYQIVQALGLATNGMLGAHLADRLRIQTSWMTILRCTMALPTEPVQGDGGRFHDLDHGQMTKRISTVDRIEK